MDAAKAGYVYRDTANAATCDWTVSRLIAGGAYPELAIDTATWDELVPGRPLDAVLLGRVRTTVVGDQVVAVRPWLGDATSVYAAENSVRCPIGDIVERASILGLPLPESAHELPESTDFIRGVMRYAHRPEAPGHYRLPALKVLVTALEYGLTPAQARAELRARAIAHDETLDALVEQPPPRRRRGSPASRATGCSPGEPTTTCRSPPSRPSRHLPRCRPCR
ncbi:hypothetical protein [Herbiconiux daphne]|uniref:AbiEi antitoxin C-terminal domain-containing protein n=1 Tax=Herbiconiux daphne TaxID=2970914 RepID=A0ABT2H1Q3_9MICO|nr:hypothetical protein [Herbiconiux daphne]MCS5733842.1 hypothetical protein [Herbiconiux daphne]